MEEILLRLILKENYEEFLTDAVRFLKEDEECMVDDMSDIIKAISIATILIGFTKKPVNLDKYSVKLNHKTIKVDTKNFCNVFKNYIEKVEQIKLNMLKEIT